MKCRWVKLRKNWLENRNHAAFFEVTARELDKTPA